MEESIERLVVAAQGGDRTALGRLLIHFDARLRARLAARIPRDLQGVLDVSDVLQEAYVQVYRHVARFDPRRGGSFAQWLVTIAERKLLDAVKRLRAAKRSPPPGARRIGRERETSLLGLARVLDPGARTPSRVVARREAVHALEAALAALPEPCRRVVWLRHIENQSVSEVARAVGRSERAVEQLCYRGLQRLRECLGSRSKYLSGS